jgi:hypothetical protein
MSRASVIHWSGLAAMLGGGLWAGASVLMALRPRGVPGGPYRETGDLTAAMFVSLILILVGLAGAHIRQAEGAGRSARTALVLPYVGALLMILGAAGLAVGLDIPWVVVMLGLFAASIGTLLFGLAAFRAGVLPRAAALLLVVGALALLRFNTEDWRALLALPFGASWAWLGYTLRSIEDERRATAATTDLPAPARPS